MWLLLCLLWVLFLGVYTLHLMASFRHWGKDRVVSVCLIIVIVVADLLRIIAVSVVILFVLVLFVLLSFLWFFLLLTLGIDLLMKAKHNRLIPHCGVSSLFILFQILLALFIVLNDYLRWAFSMLFLHLDFQRLFVHVLLDGVLGVFFVVFLFLVLSLTLLGLFLKIKIVKAKELL